MKPKKMILMISALLMVVLITMQPVFAWFYYYRTSFLMVTGDVRITVQGWAQSANDDIELTYEEELDKEFNDFSFKEVSMDNFVAFRFKVTNIESKDAVLSARFSDFSEYIFEHFSEYYEERKTSQTISGGLEDKIFEAAESNTAKLATILDDIYYKDVNGETVEYDLPDKHLWQYSCGQKYFEDIFLPGVVTGEGGNKTESFVELYFVIRSAQDQASPDEYRKWLCGDEENTGYGQERLANMMGYTWAVLPEDRKTIVDEYLGYFVQKELESMSTIVDGVALIRLDLKYFEFIGENARP